MNPLVQNSDLPFGRKAGAAVQGFKTERRADVYAMNYSRGMKMVKEMIHSNRPVAAKKQKKAAQLPQQRSFFESKQRQETTKSINQILGINQDIRNLQKIAAPLTMLELSMKHSKKRPPVIERQEPSQRSNNGQSACSYVSPTMTSKLIKINGVEVQQKSRNTSKKRLEKDGLRGSQSIHTKYKGESEKCITSGNETKHTVRKQHEQSQKSFLFMAQTSQKSIKRGSLQKSDPSKQASQTAKRNNVNSVNSIQDSIDSLNSYQSQRLITHAHQ